MTKLRSTINSPRMGQRVMEAFELSDLYNAQETYEANYEHGQWWINARSGAAWSVVDATGGPAIDGFDFEQIARGVAE